MRLIMPTAAVSLILLLAGCNEAGNGNNASDNASQSQDQADSRPQKGPPEDRPPSRGENDREVVASQSQSFPEELRDEVDTALRACDPLDGAHCMYPFPSDHFTRAVAPDQIGGTGRGGTGRRIDFNRLAMPRNIAGKPIDPLEWNRNDGFSPGQLITTFIPELAFVTDESGQPTGPVRNAVPFNDLERYTDPNTAVIVLDTETGERHPIWVERDASAGMLFPPNADETLDTLTRPGQARHAMLVRPAVNFREGRRYVVAIRHIENSEGEPIAAPPFFAKCRDQGADAFALPALKERCEQLQNKVFPVLKPEMPVQDNDRFYLAWDFTVASTENNVARLRHMRDDAFATLAEDESPLTAMTGPEAGADCVRYQDGAPCQAPEFTIDRVVEESPENTKNGRMYREIHGTVQVPSYVVPQDPSPLEGLGPLSGEVKTLAGGGEDSVARNLLDSCLEGAPVAELCQPFQFLLEGTGEVPDALQIGESVSLPPNRLFYNPLDELHPDDPKMQPFGDGLPDQTGHKSVPFVCRLYEDASGGSPARAGIYGHGLFDQRGAITYDAVPGLSTFDPDNNFMFCAADWYGFAIGDIGNVLTALPELSRFPVVPDATQQGMLHKMFLARLLRHPEGLAASEAFQDEQGRPRFDHRHVFYHGISQGGILGGPVVAMSQDITRGVLGVPGMSYSLLLRRSTGWSRPAFADEVPFGFSTLPNLAYQDDLDRNLMFALLQMLWDRGENNGYAHHITNNSALNGPDNQVMLRPAYADHLVTHWSAYNLARTLIASSDTPFLADLYPRLTSDCPEGHQDKCFDNRQQWHQQRNLDKTLLFGMPLSGPGTPYDAPGGQRTELSGLIQWDEGRTAIPPIANRPADWKDNNDPHKYPRSARGAYCQQSHFLHPEGRLIDVRSVIRAGGSELALCPELPR
ncbi:MAG: hypothetical protein R3296_11855 [Oleiphilaceae bacterium]|nr:hypothetical protein [Oleiphilaceae bacterium]